MSAFPNPRDCEHGSQRGKCVECENAQLRAELAAAEALADAHQEQAARVAEQASRREAEAREEIEKLRQERAGFINDMATIKASAREEQREACADFAEQHLGASEAADMRSAPLSATPLATRIAELEADAKACSEEDDAAHRLLDAALCEGEPGTTSMETMAERLPRLIRERDLLLKAGLEQREAAESERDALKATLVTMRVEFEARVTEVCEQRDALKARVATVEEYAMRFEKERDAAIDRLEKLEAHVRKGDRFIGSVERAEAAEARAKEVETANATLVSAIDKLEVLLQLDQDGRLRALATEAHAARARVAELEAVVKSCEFTLEESRNYGRQMGCEAMQAKEHAEYVSSVLGAATTRLESARADAERYRKAAEGLLEASTALMRASAWREDKARWVMQAAIDGVRAALALPAPDAEPHVKGFEMAKRVRAFLSPDAEPKTYPDCTCSLKHCECFVRWNAALLEGKVELMAVAERVREACAMVIDPSDTIYGVDAEHGASIATAIRAIDLAALLQEGER